MAVLKFRDYRTNSYETTFGSCELCFSTGVATESQFGFDVYEGGKLVDSIWVDGFYWSWGDFFTIQVDNLIDFGIWLDDQDFEVEDYKNFDYGGLANLVLEYDCYREDNEIQ